MQRAHFGQRLGDVMTEREAGTPMFQSSSLDQIRRSREGKVEPVNDGHVIVAAHPLVLGATAGELRPTRVGCLLLVDDYSSAEAAAIRAVRSQARSFFVLATLLAGGLGLFFHFAVARRLGRLPTLAQEFGSGKSSVQSGIRGSDEVASLARSIDQMVLHKTASDKERDDVTERLNRILEAVIDAIITIAQETRAAR